MGKTIYVDDEVARKIEERAQPFETRNDVLRKVFKLGKAARKRGRPKAVLKGGGGSHKKK